MQRYALIGTGHRAQMYLDAIGGPHAGSAVLVALADTNPGRLAYHKARLVAEFGYEADTLAEYGPEDLEAMVADQRIDRVIITSPDYTHAGLICRALRAGAEFERGVQRHRPAVVNDLGRRDRDFLLDAGQVVAIEPIVDVAIRRDGHVMRLAERAESAAASAASATAAAFDDAVGIPGARSGSRREYRARVAYYCRLRGLRLRGEN